MSDDKQKFLDKNKEVQNRFATRIITVRNGYHLLLLLLFQSRS